MTITDYIRFRDTEITNNKNLKNCNRKVLRYIKKDLRIVGQIGGQIVIYLSPNLYFTPACYIQELIGQLRNDVFPLFSSTPGAAPFTVLRNMFSFIDHVARLRFGKRGSSGDMISLFDNFGTYASIQKEYRVYRHDLIQLYRHDLVHNVRPWPLVRSFMKKGVQSRSVVYFHIRSELGKMLTRNPPQDFFTFASLFKNARIRRNLAHLKLDQNLNIVINNYCIFFDLINFLNSYKDDLDGNRGVDDFVKNYIGIVIENLGKLTSQPPIVIR